MKSIWGYGSVKFVTDSHSVEFPTGIGQITYKKISIKVENINRDIIEKVLGYRVMISVELTNLLEDDYLLFSDLLTILNSGEEITIYPQGEGIFVTDVMLDSDVTFNQLHLLEIGQTIKLKFTNKDLVTSLNQYIGGLTSDNFTFNSDNATFNSDNAVVN